MAAKVLDVLSHVIKAWHVALLVEAEVIKARHVALEVSAGVGHLMLLGPLGCTTSTVLHNYLVNDFTAGVWGVCVTRVVICQLVHQASWGGFILLLLCRLRRRVGCCRGNRSGVL